MGYGTLLAMVYALDITMNFGVIAFETISAVRIEPEHPKLFKIQEFFRVHDLTCVVFETNSTGSCIKVFTTSVQINPYLA
ncbi:hypothetical protein ROLI_016240 [Roseobacter fucihabitans]|uniref:Uncharacterized protein n=1 Tax=Roseobacter fucihabitans TaxID=1537242 RepID=A0ABZ2BRF5_9RHOB|nr:hypothetical protein [Roseobacter litoralis]